MAAKTFTRKTITEIATGALVRFTEWDAATGSYTPEVFVAVADIKTRVSEGLKAQRTVYVLIDGAGRELAAGLANSKVAVKA